MSNVGGISKTKLAIIIPSAGMAIVLLVLFWSSPGPSISDNENDLEGTNPPVNGTGSNGNSSVPPFDPPRSDWTDELQPIVSPFANLTDYRTIGFPIDNSHSVGLGVNPIVGPDDMISIRFTAKYSGNAESIAVYLLTNGNHTAQVGLQADSDGLPSGQWLGPQGNSYGVRKVGKTDQFVEFKLNEAAALTRGNVYHIVVLTQDSDTGTESQILQDNLLVASYRAQDSVQPYNSDVPDTVWLDSVMNVLSNDGTGWKPNNRWPIFVVKYDNGDMEGQPYSLAAPWVLSGQRVVGQQIVPSSDYTLVGFGFVVAINTNTPDEPLYFQIFDNTNNVVSRGIFAQASDLTKKKDWFEVGLPSSIELKKGETYRIVLSSPKTDSQHSYKVFGHEFTYDSRIGYGALDSQLIISDDGGNTWGRWEDADAIFRLYVSEK